MLLSIKRHSFSKSDLGLFLLTLYCLGALGFLLIGTGAIWLRSWGPVIPRLFNASSGSMLPTLHAEDLVLVTMHGWQTAQPRRGDIAVFKLPKNPSIFYLKRVIGIPGDRIQILNGVLHINEQPVQRERLEDYKTTDIYDRTISVPQYRETLPGGMTYNIIERDGDRGYWDSTDVYTLQPGHYFMLGDNRDNSTDSRDEANVGQVPVGNISGYVALILWSKDKRRAGSVPR